MKENSNRISSNLLNKDQTNFKISEPYIYIIRNTLKMNELSNRLKDLALKNRSHFVIHVTKRLRVRLVAIVGVTTT